MHCGSFCPAWTHGKLSSLVLCVIFALSVLGRGYNVDSYSVVMNYFYRHLNSE